MAGSEIAVIIPYGPRVFKKNGNDQLRSLRRYVRRWLNDLGPAAEGIDNCSASNPWRHRCYRPGHSHVFLFHDKGQAMYFKLRFGGS